MGRQTLRRLVTRQTPLSHWVRGNLLAPSGRAVGVTRLLAAVIAWSITPVQGVADNLEDF